MTATEIATDNKRSGVDRLRAQAAEASQVRALSTHPDVVALRVESIRTQVDRCMWLGIVLGLAFTMVNVQAFAAGGALVGSLPWFAAWLLDPMVSLVLIAVLRAEQITARYQVSDARTVDRPDEAVRVRRDLRDEHVGIVPARRRGRDRAALGAAAAGVLRCRDRPGAAGPAHRGRPARRAGRRAGGPAEGR